MRIEIRIIYDEILLHPCHFNGTQAFREDFSIHFPTSEDQCKPLGINDAKHFLYLYPLWISTLQKRKANAERENFERLAFFFIHNPSSSLTSGN